MFLYQSIKRIEKEGIPKSRMTEGVPSFVLCLLQKGETERRKKLYVLTNNEVQFILYVGKIGKKTGDKKW